MSTLIRPPVKPPLPRLRPIASISSMKMIEGASNGGGQVEWVRTDPPTLPATSSYQSLGWSLLSTSMIMGRVRDLALPTLLDILFSGIRFIKHTCSMWHKGSSFGKIISWRYWSRTKTLQHAVVVCRCIEGIWWKVSFLLHRHLCQYTAVAMRNLGLLERLPNDLGNSFQYT